MHIKKIVIQGFKTYKNTTVIDDLSPGHNVVVGRNGSGKSNFFAAIRFVLSDQYTRMSKEERQGLIHEGSGSVLSAYVEIIFDNSDGRFPTGRPEVVIRRTIGLKKDDFSLDGKSSTRVDVMQLLESAGFSKSNPYYIVPQGRITSLTNAKDSERLNLLKEVAGAQVFENKLRESQKEMTKTKNQRDKIDEMLVFIEDRLSDLNSEKDELKDFQDLERDKKIYEYKLYDHELNGITTAIEEIESDYQNATENAERFIENMEKGEIAVAELTKSIDTIESELKLLKIDRQQNVSIVDEISKTLYDKKATLSELRENLETQQETIKTSEKAFQKLEKERAENERLTSLKKPNVDKLRATQKDLETQISTLKTKQNLLYSKQGRYSKFNSKKERDTWIKSQIKGHQSEKNDKLSETQANKNQLQTYTEDLSSLSGKLNQLEQLMNGPQIQGEIEKLEQQIASVKAEMTAENDNRKTIWRETDRCENIVASLKGDLTKAERDVATTMDRQLNNGLQAVERIKKSLGLTGVYGTLGELIDVNSKYRTAVEVIAGNQLFQVVVDNDETASALMNELIRQKAGRVTFMPLNRLKPKQHTYPDTQDCVPLIKKIAYPQDIEKAVLQVFGKTIVTMDLARGYELSKEFNLSAITLDGDKAEKKGLLTGGYVDNKKSRIEAMKLKKIKLAELKDKEAEFLRLKMEDDKKGQQIVKLNDELSKLHTQMDKVITQKKELRLKYSNLLAEKFKIEDYISILQDQITDAETFISTIDTKIHDLEGELGTEFQEGLAQTQKEELQTINKKLSQLESLLSSTMDQLYVEESELRELEIELSESIIPRLHEIMKRTKSKSDADFDQEIQKLTEEVENLNEQHSEATIAAESNTATIDAKTRELRDLKENLEKINTQQKKLIRSFENFQKNSERSMAKRQVLLKRRDESQAKIRQLGTLPDAAFDENYDFDRDVLLKRLNEVTDGLEKFSHVNRKALEQFLNFTKQRDSLVERRKELDNSEESIVDLMKHLSERKNEAIDKTFSEVASAFTDVFEKLVPKGTGRLIMQKKTGDSQAAGGDEDDEVMNDEQADEEGIENYSGVSIQVSFNSKSDEQQRIEQLSGGQKSLCAIALILAIQKSDPAPFYLFDEIDANLDTQYRTAVANMIHELSANAQFICTTFRPEMLQVANKFFGVSFNNKISSVSEIDQSFALGFVEGEQKRA
ncbi:Chromosome segregation protein sudA [Cyberlindnera fabianii]|uniref:Structural maintenance of chromosomes protein n=1 Tax=Cyberlindnera fabianii TaxID=36022 RepID=A0A1V2LBN4_CYBFA|nr:Chromosome segregation protein sudA [Cyberlindnera fabianii]